MVILVIVYSFGYFIFGGIIPAKSGYGWDGQIYG